MSDRRLGYRGSTGGRAAPNLRWFFFGLSGRIGRLPYILGNLFFVAVTGVIINQLMIVPEDSREIDLWSLLFMLLLPTVLWTSIAMAVKRLHDINLPGPVAICLFVPAVSLVAVLVLCFWPGTQGGNDYGDETNRPKEPRT